MGEFTAEEAAIRAQVDRGEVDRLLSLGVIEPDADGRFSTGHVRRIRILRSLERSGLPLEGIAEGMRQGIIGLDFADMPTYERFDPLGQRTFSQLSAESGVPIDLLIAVREAMGFAPPGPEDRVGLEELEVVPLIQFMLHHEFHQPVIERALRTYGESLRRIAETEAAWWNSEVQRPLLQRGATYREIVDSPAQCPWNWPC